MHPFRLRTGAIQSSRGASVIRKKTPDCKPSGSPKAVKESLGFILTPGAWDGKILRGSASECQTPNVGLRGRTTDRLADAAADRQSQRPFTA